MEYTCQVCNSPFQGRPSGKRLYCSRKCYGQVLALRVAGEGNPSYSGKNETRTCEWCKAPFKVSARDASRRPARYCGKRCYGDAKIAAEGEKRAQQAKPCKKCGKPFYVCASQSGRLFCSQACRLEFLRKKRESACKQCGTTYDRTYPTQRYCSLSCRSIANSGVNNPQWKGGEVEQKCVTCGKGFTVARAVAANGYGKFCSQRCLGHYRSSHAPATHRYNGKGGKRPDLNNRYFRSAWEANYARYLNLLIEKGEILKWEYEVDTFEFEGIKRGTTFYTPDFKVFHTDGRIEYHEVKGYMSPEGQTKLNRMKKYHPDVVVLLIDRKVYTPIARQCRFIIPTWEHEAKHSR